MNRQQDPSPPEQIDSPYPRLVKVEEPAIDGRDFALGMSGFLWYPIFSVAISYIHVSLGMIAALLIPFWMAYKAALAFRRPVMWVLVFATILLMCGSMTGWLLDLIGRQG